METDSDPELASIRARMLKELAAGPSAAASDHPIDVTDASLAQFANANGVAVVDVWAEWCGPCRIVGPIVDQLAKEMHGRVAFAKLDADTNPRTMQKYGILGIPTLLVFKNGKHVDNIVGALPKPQLAARIERAAAAG